MNLIFLLIDQLLYWFSIYWQNKQTNKQTNKRNLNVENYQKDKCFPSPHRWKLRPSWQSSQRKGFGRFLAWKKVFNCNNLLNESIQIKFYHSVFLAVVERLSFFSKNKWTNAKYEKLIWSHLTFKSPYLSCLMRQRENIFYIAWSEQLIKSQKKHVCDLTSSREVYKLVGAHCLNSACDPDFKHFDGPSSIPFRGHNIHVHMPDDATPRS